MRDAKTSLMHAMGVCASLLTRCDRGHKLRQNIIMESARTCYAIADLFILDRDLEEEDFNARSLLLSALNLCQQVIDDNPSYIDNGVSPYQLKDMCSNLYYLNFSDE